MGFEDNLPPGCTSGHIEEAANPKIYCAVCQGELDCEHDQWVNDQTLEYFHTECFVERENQWTQKNSIKHSQK